MPQFLRRHRRVFPAFPGILCPGYARCGPEPGATHQPNVLLLRGIVIELHARGVGLSLQRCHQSVRLVIRLLLALATKLHQQPAAPIGEQRDILRVQTFLLHIVHQNVIQSLQPNRSMRQHLHNVVASGVDIGIAEDEQRAYRWALDEAYGGFGEL